MFRLIRPTLCTLVLLVHPLTAAFAQDTMRVELPPVVVTAERFQNQLSESTTAIAKIDRFDIERMPGRSLTDIIATLPGIGFISRDGDGRDALATVRGFYGGGDVEYLVVLVDGLPVNDMETGLVAWESIPAANVERIELLRGGSSSLYGDAAIGGVLNIITRADARRGGAVALSGGSYDSYGGNAFVSEMLGDVPVQLSGDYERTSGFRADAKRENGAVNLRATIVQTENLQASVRSDNSWRALDLPGPMQMDGSQSVDIVSGDFLDESRNNLSVELRGRARKLSWRAVVGGGLRNAKGRNSLVLAPFFADRRERELNGKRLMLSVGTTIDLGRYAEVVAGLDAATSNYESTYYKVDATETGTELTRGPVDEKGTASRTFAGVYTQLEIKPVESLTLSAGVRGDGLWNAFTPKSPSDGEDLSVTHSAVSPKLGANYEILDTGRNRLNAYVSAGTSFKSPALDQLYGQRNITVAFGEDVFDVSTSNGDLKPQRGKHIEAGLYGSLLGAAGRAELSATVYRIDMRDELDVDLATFQLINIGKSRHDGVELGASLYGLYGTTAFASYTLQSTTFRNGDLAGNFVKAIPRDLYSAGLAQSTPNGFVLSFSVRGRGRTFVDDPNTVQLDDYLVMDAKASYERGPIRAEGAVLNLRDEEYLTTGYPDPSGSDVLFVYPSAGRTLRLSLEYRW